MIRDAPFFFSFLHLSASTSFFFLNLQQETGKKRSFKTITITGLQEKGKSCLLSAEVACELNSAKFFDRLTCQQCPCLAWARSLTSFFSLAIPTCWRNSGSYLKCWYCWLWLLIFSLLQTLSILGWFFSRIPGLYEKLVLLKDSIFLDFLSMKKSLQSNVNFIYRLKTQQGCNSLLINILGVDQPHGFRQCDTDCFRAGG